MSIILIHLCFKGLHLIGDQAKAIFQLLLHELDVGLHHVGEELGVHGGLGWRHLLHLRLWWENREVLGRDDALDLRALRARARLGCECSFRCFKALLPLSKVDHDTTLLGIGVIDLCQVIVGRWRLRLIVWSPRIK